MHASTLSLAVASGMLLALFSTTNCTSNLSVPGGWSAEKPGDVSAQEVADAVKTEVLRQLADARPVPSEFVVVKYTTQIVAGKNYILKIRVGPGRYVQVDVFRSLQNTFTVKTVLRDVMLLAPLRPAAPSITINT
ncbi:hypothetical protein BV898_08810 [Hypsibius exemplaris]|uniref:Cystatin domain-containing protein n=1 Tax=Hypsibius exemplaris TaxID=2072580 RepID=A0A1W0WPG8_HYPEX|nr:hypothetical protein BV898_08810 [Hypsibius exemplaris]